MTHSTYKETIPKPVNYSVIKKSAVFNRKNMSFSLDSLNNSLLIRLTINELKKDFPFPVNTEYKDTLTNTAFNFDFYNNGRLILSDYNSMRNRMEWKDGFDETVLRMHADTIDMKYHNDMLFEIPFYAFHSLKRGKQTIELHIWQDAFTDKVDVTDTDGSFRSHHLSIKKTLFDARVKFDIIIPTIYKSTIYGQGLVLKNDSTFSPVGMDNTIWKSSYPDIYWTVIYPKEKFYAQTPYETSTDQYAGLDTFTLYHYYLNDSIGFGVYDHDNLSRDDFLGYWWGDVNSLSGAGTNELAFDNIKSFKVAVRKGGIIN